MTTTAIRYKEATLTHGRTRYLDVGTGHPVIMLHGSSIEQGADDWLPCLDILTERFRVIAPDFLGWPPSDPVPANADAFPFLTDFVREFQDAVGLKSSHVVGASMGAWITGLLAYESPNRVDKVVITGNPGFQGSPNAGIANWKMSSDEVITEWMTNVTRTIGPERDSLLATKLRRAHDPAIQEGFASVMRTMGDTSNRHRYALLRRLPFITAPTLFLFGSKDPAMEVLEQAKATLPGSKSVVIEAGHRLHIEKPEEFSRAVVDFLK